MLPEFDVYLAGPFFNDEQKKNCAAVRLLLETAGLAVCDPQELSPVITDLPESERGPKLFKRVFDGNVEGLERSWAYVFMTDDKDTGTSWEFGYAFKAANVQKKGPLITLSFIGKPANVMLAQAAHLHYKTLDDLSANIGTLATVIKMRKHVLHAAPSELAKADQ